MHQVLLEDDINNKIFALCTLGVHMESLVSTYWTSHGLSNHAIRNSIHQYFFSMVENIITITLKLRLIWHHSYDDANPVMRTIPAKIGISQTCLATSPSPSCSLHIRYLGVIYYLDFTIIVTFILLQGLWESQHWNASKSQKLRSQANPSLMVLKFHLSP